MQTQQIPAVGTVIVALSSATKPSRLARQWELVEFIGRGSLAKVFRARPAGSPADRAADYAVKILRRRWENDPQAVGMLQREALVGQSVSNPHLMPILSAAVKESPRLLVMPWLSGASLAKRLSSQRQFDATEALWIARQTAEALDALHAAGWIHGDVTPGNIHISSSGHATLLDLNFARRDCEIGSAVERPIMGTCGYMAPEYFTSALLPNIRSDIYSLGAVLYEMFSGRRPFSGETLSEMAVAHRQSEPDDLFSLAPHIPREAVCLVRQMMAKDPLRRPQTPRELIERLSALEIATFSLRGG